MSGWLHATSLNIPKTRGSTEVISKGENPGVDGAKSGLPDDSGSKLKRVTMAPKLRTNIDMANDPA
jgi:hypothetical protein